VKRQHRATSVGTLAAGVAVAAAALTASAARPGPPALLAGGQIPNGGRLLWLDGRPTISGFGTVAARDSAGRVLLADDRLRIREAALPGDLGSVVSAAPAPGGGLWVADTHSRLRHLTADGSPVAEIVAPYAVSALGGIGRDGRLSVVRSAEGFPFLLDTLPRPPVALVDPTGHATPDYLGVATQPSQPLLTDLANAGYVATAGSLTIFAPFVRDEVVAFTPYGDTSWMVRRGLVHETPDPRFRLRAGRPVLDYFPVNLGLAIGPQGRVYVLSTSDTSLARGRLDVLDPTTGDVLATLALPTAFPTIIVTRAGNVHVVPSGRLLERATEATRPKAPSFAWPASDGREVDHASLLGRVTVVNVWASWCEPCREEMPALVRLWQSLADSGLAFLAVNEDIRVEAARAWLRDQGLEPPVAFARGMARRTFGYRGLPYTVVVDREGRIVHKWSGYLGGSQIAEIEAVAKHELQLLEVPRAASELAAHRHEVGR